MPDAGDAADLYVGPLNDAMAAHGIVTAAQRAAFLAQIAVESKQLHRTEEGLYYTTVQRMMVVWPGLFPTEASAAPYLRNPEALSNHVYACGNGNGDEESGDGFRYRGRGFMQVTGRANYRAGGFEDNPDAMAEPQNAANSAAVWWQNKRLDGRTSVLLDRKQFDAVTRAVNRHKLDAQERWDAYQRALDAFGVSQ